MARQKKSRKTGLIGVRKSPDFKKVEKEKRIKKPQGKPAGSRNNHSTADSGSNKGKINKDPRLGSKKPINLAPSAERVIISKPNIQRIPPEQELANIEADTKLSQFIEQLDSGASLDRQSQDYVTKKLNRHKELCEQLGIVDDEAVEMPKVEQTEDDLYASFEKFDVNKLKDY